MTAGDILPQIMLSLPQKGLPDEYRNRSISHPERRAARCRRACDRARLAEGHAGASALATAPCCSARDGESHRVEAHPDAGVLVARERWRALRHRRRRRPGGGDGAPTVPPQTLAETKGAWIDSLASSTGGAFAYGDRQARDRPRRQGPREDPRGSRPPPGARLRAEGLSARDRPLQRRDAVVSQHRGQAGIAGMEGLASRRHLVAGCAASSSPPCRRTRSTAGGSCPTRATCA